MSWLKQFFLRRRIYGDLSEEIREHLEEKIDELVAEGMSRKEATAAARRAFGNLTLTEEDSRNVWRWPSVEELLADVRYGLRALRHNLMFTAVALLTIAIGIGANAAVFSVVNSVLLKPLNYPNAEQLVSLHQIALARQDWRISRTACIFRPPCISRTPSIIAHFSHWECGVQEPRALQAWLSRSRYAQLKSAMVYSRCWTFHLQLGDGSPRQIKFRAVRSA